MYVLEWVNSYGDIQVWRPNFATLTDRQWEFLFELRSARITLKGTES